MNRTLTLILFILSCLSSEAQKKLVPLDHKLQPIQSENDAVYILESNELDSNAYDVKIYYADMTPLMDGHSKDDSGQVLTGETVWYYKNGQVQSEGKYIDGRKSGTWRRFNEDGSAKSDRVYSDLSMETMVFSSALYMPKPQVDDKDLVLYLRREITARQGFDIIAISPIDIEVLISRKGNLDSVRYDKKLSPDQMAFIDNIINDIPYWKPGSNGTQNLNVRTNYTIDFNTDQ